MGNDVVLFEKGNGIGLITMNRPAARNSLNAAVFQALDAVLDRVRDDDDVRVLVLTGAGDSFAAGADINELLTFSTQVGWSASRFSQSVMSKLERIGKPSIAAVNGAALGGGLELALSCTFRVASEKAKLGFPEMGLGIIPAFGGTQRAVRCVGQARAAELILFRKIIDAAEAFRIGLVSAVLEHEQVMSKSMEMAHDLSSLSPVATRFELELLHESENKGFDTGFALESALGALAVSSKEAKELLAGFLAKGKGGHKG
jgi:enoyl-CoA hydratase